MVRWISFSPPLVVSYLNRKNSPALSEVFVLSKLWPLRGNRIDLIDENDRGSVLLCDSEHLPHLSSWDCLCKLGSWLLALGCCFDVGYLLGCWAVGVCCWGLHQLGTFTQVFLNQLASHLKAQTNRAPFGGVPCATTSHQSQLSLRSLATRRKVAEVSLATAFTGPNPYTIYKPLTGDRWLRYPKEIYSILCIQNNGYWPSHLARILFFVGPIFFLAFARSVFPVPGTP